MTNAGPRWYCLATQIGGQEIAFSRPPLAVVLVFVCMLALGETGGAVMSRLKGPTERWAAARIAANATAHGFSGSAEYDDEVRDRAIWAAEAGLSFFHTHAEGLGLVLFFTSGLVAGVVPWRRARGALYLLLTLGGVFPLGYLVYGLAVLERGRDTGIELAETWVLAPLGSAAILGLISLVLALILALRSHAASAAGHPRPKATTRPPLQ